MAFFKYAPVTNNELQPDWYFNFETPSGALSGRKKVIIGRWPDDFWAIRALVNPSYRFIQTLSGDRTMPLEIGRHPDGFYETFISKLSSNQTDSVQWPDCLCQGNWRSPIGKRILISNLILSHQLKVNMALTQPQNVSNCLLQQWLWGGGEFLEQLLLFTTRSVPSETAEWGLCIQMVAWSAKCVHAGAVQ